jgi:hypothetical protein
MFMALGATALLAAGCASKEEPAQTAVEAAEAALNEVRPDAAKYVPDQLHATEAHLTAIKNDFAQKKYREVILAVPRFKEEAHALEDAAVAKQTQVAAATREWTELSAEVPKNLEAIEQRVANLKGAKLPKEMSKESFETAKSTLEEIKSTWAEANAAATAGNPTEAADKGRVVQQKAKEVSEQLGMSPV